MIAVYIVIGLVAGGALTFLLMKMKLSKLENNSDLLTKEKVKLEDVNVKLSSENKNLTEENIRLKTRTEYFETHIEYLKQNFEKEKELLQQYRADSEKNAEKLRIESDSQWQIKFDKLKEEFQNVASKLLADKQASLQENNNEQINAILQPIRQQFDAFKKSVEESKTSNEVAKKELIDSFESTMKLFALQQNQTVEALKQETLRIGNDAKNLTDALKRDSKKQGNWGELILESLLEASGLIKDVHYFIQETITDSEGKMKRPDVIVRFPEGKSVVIDSKVSLTAYAEAFENEDLEIRRKRLKDHAKSVRNHIDELSAKKYDTLDKDNIGFILMFIPNDQCYLTAMEEEPDLSRYAYSKGIVIISPSNLMMALQLAYNMWQQDIRNRNIDNIVLTASDLYDKVANFSSTMEALGKTINQASEKFYMAKNQLYEGRGNVMRRIEDLKKLGITPNKQIKGLEDE